jgi:hypothetical protein
MKFTKQIITSGAIITTVVLFFLSCKREVGKEVATEQTNFNNSAIIQIYNASVPSPAATDPRRNYVYVDGNPITGAPIAFGSFFPSSSTGASLTGGFKQFLIKDTISTSTQPPISFSETFQAGKSYTIFMYDTFTAIKQKTVETIIQIPADTTARVRFANFIYSPTAFPGNFDIFSVKRNAVIFSNIATTEITNFIPYASALTDTFYVRLNGSSANLQNVDTTGKPTILDIQAILTPTRLRSYTLIFRGGYKSSANKTTTGTAIGSARTLSTFANN